MPPILNFNGLVHQELQKKDTFSITSQCDLDVWMVFGLICKGFKEETESHSTVFIGTISLGESISN